MELEKKTKLDDFLLEVELGDDSDFNKTFNLALKQVFNSRYLSKVNDMINRRIKFKEFNNVNKNILAYNKGNTIYVNKIPFQERTIKRRMEIILHEFIHLVQRKRKVIFFKQFKEIDDLTEQLNIITRKYLKPRTPLSVFLTGKLQKLGPGGKHEILGYLMSNSIKWDAISIEGKGLFIDALKRSGIFDLSNSFWKKRLQ